MEPRGMTDHKHDGQQWMSCVMCRSLNQSKSLLYRTMQRKVQWPQTNISTDSRPSTHTDVDNAFANVLQSLNTTSRQCKKLYKTCASKSLSNTDSDHISRFHGAPRKQTAIRKNPMLRAEDVNFYVQPGTYAVTIGEWGSGQQQKHVVNVEDGQSVNLNFIL